jgi:hypothetical protein
VASVNILVGHGEREKKLGGKTKFCFPVKKSTETHPLYLWMRYCRLSANVNDISRLVSRRFWVMILTIEGNIFPRQFEIVQAFSLWKVKMYPFPLRYSKLNTVGGRSAEQRENCSAPHRKIEAVFNSRLPLIRNNDRAVQSFGREMHGSV